MRRQTYPHDKIEVVLADSGSQDGTKECMREFKNCMRASLPVYRYWKIQVVSRVPDGMRLSVVLRRML